MRAARLGAHLEQRVAARREALAHAPRRAPRAGPRVVSTLMRFRSRGCRPIARSTRPAGRRRRAAHDREVDALDGVVVELRGERRVRGVALRGDEHARRAAVEAVHDARAAARRRCRRDRRSGGGARSRACRRDGRAPGARRVRRACRRRSGPRPRGARRARSPRARAVAATGSGGSASIRSPAATRCAARTVRPSHARAALVDPAPRLRARDTGKRRERLVGAETGEVVAHEQEERARAFHHQIRERTARLRKISTSTTARPNAFVRVATAGLHALLEVGARLRELLAQALEQIVGLDAGAHLVRVVEHHVGEDGAGEPHGALRIGDLPAHRRTRLENRFSSLTASSGRGRRRGPSTARSGSGRPAGGPPRSAPCSP